MGKILGGASILGVYPPDAETLREFEEWRYHQTPVILPSSHPR
jgi:hypothetical protein